MLNRTAGIIASAIAMTALVPGCQPAHDTRRPAAPQTTESSPAFTSPLRHTSPTPQAGPHSHPASNPGGLTDRQMVGQLFMAYVYGSGAHQVTPQQREANLALYQAATPAAVVKRWHLGGIILIDHNNLDPARSTLSTGNVNSASQIRNLTMGLQQAARNGRDPLLLIATDQEGGQVQRIRAGVDPRPSQHSLAHIGRAALTCSYQQLGSQLRALGVNQDFAPDADVVRTSSGVIGDRSFGPNPVLDAVDVSAAVSGLQSAGVLATLKHWPGHGSTATDSHQALAYVREDAATWRRIDRVPFAHAAAKAKAIMVGHLAVPALDRTHRPATFSPMLTQRLLRNGLGYRGMIVTDSLWMAPARKQGSPGQMALRALAAGNDLLLEPPDLPASYRAVLRAMQSKPRVRKLVQRAASHVLAAKAAVKHANRRTSLRC